MQIRGLHRVIYRGARLSSRLDAKTSTLEAARRDDLLRRWLRARQGGLTAQAAADVIGEARATLFRWHKQRTPKSTRPPHRAPCQARSKARARRRTPAQNLSDVGQRQARAAAVEAGLRLLGLEGRTHIEKACRTRRRSRRTATTKVLETCAAQAETCLRRPLAA